MNDSAKNKDRCESAPFDCGPMNICPYRVE